MYGHKKIFILGWLWFALWSFMCGFAYNWGVVALCVARGLQGIGPALLVPNGIALIGRSFPPGDKRALVIGVFGACGPCGFLTGAAFSAMFAELVCEYDTTHSRDKWLILNSRVALGVLGNRYRSTFHNFHLLHYYPRRTRHCRRSSRPGSPNFRLVWMRQWCHRSPSHQLRTQPGSSRRVGHSLRLLPSHYWCYVHHCILLHRNAHRQVPSPTHAWSSTTGSSHSRMYRCRLG